MHRRPPLSSSRPSVSLAALVLIVLLLAGVPLVVGPAREPARSPMGTEPAGGMAHHPATLAGHAVALPPVPSHPRARPAGPQAVIDPYNFYTAEPAPMGITDFGLSSSSTAYTYNTTQFLGITWVRNFSAYDASAGLPTSISIQLNVVLQFQLGGTAYQYWIQDVIFLDTYANSPTFLNNIWNLSSTSAGLDSTSVTGNGSADGTFYYDGADGPGNGITLSGASNELDLLVVESTVSNQPAVAFEYRDPGFGWQTYDNVVFPFAHGAKGTEFLVDGTNYAPDGLYDDAELVLAGPGGGSTQMANYANASMALDYWNGHNFQSIRNAFNFGSDTAETISGVATKHSGGTSNASLSDEISIGTATLGMVYSGSYAASVNVSTAITNSTLSLGTSPGISFATGPINLTIAPGTYAVSAFNATGVIAYSSVTVSSGGYRALTLVASTVYAVRFSEVGLFGSKPWAIALGPVSQRSPSVTHLFFMANGTYSYAVTPIPGFIVNGSRGNLTVAGVDQQLTFTFVVVLYSVQVYETGLPANTTWTMHVFNQSYSTNGVSLAFGLPNGSWSYTLDVVPGYTASPHGTGSFFIQAASERVTISFQKFRLPIYVTAGGLPSGTFWFLRIGSDWTNGSIATLRALEPNGSYSYVILGDAGWRAEPNNGTVLVAGAAVFFNVSFVPFTFPVVFDGSGLPDSSPFAITVGAVRLNSTSGQVTFQLANGSYAYAVIVPVGYLVNGPTSGLFRVSGKALTVQVAFGPIPPSYGTVSGSVSPAGASLTVDGAAVTLSQGRFTLRLVVGLHQFVFSATGYVTVTRQVNVTENAAIQLPAVELQPTPVTNPPTGTTGGGGGSSGPSTTELAAIGAAVAIAVGVGAALLVARSRRAR